MATMVGSALSPSARPTVVLDWGLHRAWRVESDRAHPARPARLVEIPWSPGLGRAKKDSQAVGGTPTRPEVLAPAVQAGMRVTLWRRTEKSSIRMTGTALEAGSAGQVIAVRTAAGRIKLHGIVRGPASVELVPGKGWQ